MSILKRKILYISGTRADYGLMKGVLSEIKKSPKLSLEIAASGMHLMPEFGNTYKEIEKDGFKIHKINAVYKKDKPESMTKFLSDFIPGLSKEIKNIKPDMIFVQGDRIEMLGGAIVGAYLGIPVVHSHGGDVSSTIDEIARHSITKLSHIHFAATKKSAERILKMGEDKWRVHVVGAPGLDMIKRQRKSKAGLGGRLTAKVIVAQHPITGEIKDSAKQIKETMEAIKELKLETIVIYPNADPGGREMIKEIEKYKKFPFIKIYKNMGHKEYLDLMKRAGVLAGNSSAGIIEAPSLKLAVINIGTRQGQRERAGNTIDVGYDKNEIKKAIKKALFDKKFRENLKKIKSPYGDGKAGLRIVKILDNLKIDEKLLSKKISY